MNNVEKTLTKYCKKCQADTDRYLTTGKCKICTRVAHSAWVTANKDKDTASKKKYREENKEKIQIASEKYKIENRELINLRNRDAYQKDKDAFKVRTKSYYYRNKKKAIECRVAWRSKNKEKVAALAEKWRIKNPDKVKKAQSDYAKSHISERKTRLHNRRSAKGNISPGLFKKLFALQRGMCACCKQPLGEKPHLDHIIPLALGGVNLDWNIQLLRAKCNLQKGKKHPVDFMQSRGFLL